MKVYVRCATRILQEPAPYRRTRVRVGLEFREFAGRREGEDDKRDRIVEEREMEYEGHQNLMYVVG